MKRFNGWKGQRGGSSKRSEVVEKKDEVGWVASDLVFPPPSFFLCNSWRIPLVGLPACVDPETESGETTE